MNPCELSMNITVIANALAENLSDDDLAITAAAFTQLGDTLATIATSRALYCRTNPSPHNSDDTQTSGI